MPDDPNEPSRMELAASRMERVLVLPERDRLQSLIEVMEPGARLLQVRRLRGGITSRASAFRYRAKDGSAGDAVLRIATPGSHSAGPDHFQREMKTLRALQDTDVPAPRPLFLDTEGEFFGMAAIVVSLLPGRAPGLPARTHPFVADLARALSLVHSVSPETVLLGHLPLRGEVAVRARLSAAIDPELAAVSGGAKTWRLLRDSVDVIEWLPPRLVHEDYWPGNTLWRRGRLTGVVDWTTAAIGDPRTDVAQCRIDLALMYGPDWAEGFTSRYEEAAGRRLSDLPFWDLYVGRNAMTSLPFYLTGYHDLGLTHLTLAELHRRLDAFLSQAMSRLEE